MQSPTYIASEFLTESGLQWLKIDICNTYAEDCGNGIPTDKLDMPEQLAWVDANIMNLLDFMPNAEQPTQYRNAVCALYDNNAGKKVSHAMYVDASNQGLQLYSILTKCADTAMLCNLATGNVRQDAYTMIANELNIMFDTSVFNRKNCKKALMTKLYGSDRADAMMLSEMYGVSQDDDEALLEVLKELSSTLNLREFHADFLKEAFNSVMNKIAPLAMQAMDKIQLLNNLGREVYTWTLPDGFIAESWTKRDVEVPFEFNLNGVTETFEIEMKDQYMVNTDSKALAPNIIHSVDAYIARCVVDRLDAWCTTTHDAFACHLNNIDRLITIYKDVLIEILESDMLADIMTQIMDGEGVAPVLNYPNTLTAKHIRESLYGLY